MSFSNGIVLFTVLFSAVLTCSPPYTQNQQVLPDSTESFRIMFYNVENLFDVFDDTAKSDESFTPSGDMHWTEKRYNAKLTHICKVIVAVGKWQPPDIIGLCEIENEKVLHDLLYETPLAKFPFRIVHYDSPDRRGIDVALLYHAKRIEKLDSRSFSIGKRGLLTRDILYMKALLGKDTCHFFVNHWPSRSAGQLETEKDRLAAAGMLKHLTDSLLMINSGARILIMGDFNDDPTDESVQVKLGALVTWQEAIPEHLYNLSNGMHTGLAKGTLKYQGAWNTFDQIILSGSLMALSSELTLGKEGFRIFQHPFLLETDDRYNGYKPFRTYSGFRYQGGFSDHLPVYVDLISR